MSPKPPRHTTLYVCPICEGLVTDARVIGVCRMCYGAGVVPQSAIDRRYHGRLLRAKREATGLTIFQFAKRHGLTAQAVSDAECGIANPKDYEKYYEPRTIG